MTHAVMCVVPSTTSSIRSILEYFHGQKRQPGVDEMLCRLYEPVIWRNLKSANAGVRSNAARLFIHAFPIVEMDADRKETLHFAQP